MPDEEDSASNLLVQTLAAVNLFCKICDLVYEIRQSGCSWGTTGCDLFSFFFVVEFGALGLQYSSVCRINQLQKKYCNEESVDQCSLVAAGCNFLCMWWWWRQRNDPDGRGNFLFQLL